MLEDMYARTDSEAGIDITRLVQLRKWSKVLLLWDRYHKEISKQLQSSIKPFLHSLGLQLNEKLFFIPLFTLSAHEAAINVL